MNVTFRSRKYGRCFDSSYFIDGVSHWHVGDSVTVLLSLTPEQAAAARDGADLKTYSDTAHIPCRVVERNDAICWRSVGRLDLLTQSAVLEAESGEWEDLLAWIIVGQRPDWAGE